MSGPFADVAAGTLRTLAKAFRSGQLSTGFGPFAVGRIARCPDHIVRELADLDAAGMSPAHMALLLDACADRTEAQTARMSAELVWTGPESGTARSRDTVVVVEELLSQAQTDVLISTFVVQNGQRVFGALATRLDLLPGLRARIFLHVGRDRHDTVLESERLREFGDDLRREWPGMRCPEVYYDPRGLSSDPTTRATWHAKCVVVDEDKALVTSANFTEWAQQRNVEAGVLVTSRHFVSQLRLQFDALVEAKLVRRLPGW